MKINYDREMRKILERRAQPPTVLLQCCCGPCSSAVLLRLLPLCRVTVWFYNPNIQPREEYEKRRETLIALLKQPPYCEQADWCDAPYEPERFVSAVRGLEGEPEGGARCTRCFTLRLGETARAAKAGGYDFFATTLTVSPHKDAAEINRIGFLLEEEVGAAYLPGDFKKGDGYRQSIELSKQYNLYRQSDCGCVYARAQGGDGTQT